MNVFVKAWLSGGLVLVLMCCVGAVTTHLPEFQSVWITLVLYTGMAWVASGVVGVLFAMWSDKL